MKRVAVPMILLVLVSTSPAGANDVVSSTMHFQGALTDNGNGTYSGVLPMIDEGSPDSGYDIYALEGATAWFGNDPGSGPVWTSQAIGTDHDAWPTWTPDTPDWYQYSLYFYQDGGVQRWAVRNHPGATADHPWDDTAHWGTPKPPAGVPMSGIMYWHLLFAAETDIGAYLPGTGTAEIPDGAAGQGSGPEAWDMDWSWGSEAVPLELPGFEVGIADLGGGNYSVTLTPAPSAGLTIRDHPDYVASTGLALGPMGSEWGGSTGFTIVDPFQINLEYQAGIRNYSIDALNGYDPDGTWNHNFSDNDEYVLKIDVAGNLPVYTYPDVETPGGAQIQWTLTGWHQTILAGDIVSAGGTTYLRVVPSGIYRPFPNDPPVNDVEIFDGDVDTEVLAYTFAGAVGDIGNGSALGVILRSGTAPGNVWVDDDYCETCDNDGHFWGYDAFASIQDGVDAVAGSTVNVAPGLYEEQVVISTDDVHVIGSGSGDNPAVDTIIRCPVSLTWFYTTSSNNYPIVAFDGATGGSVENLRIDGFGRGNANYRFQGMGFWNSGGDLVDCSIVNVMDTPFSGSQHGVGIYAYNNTGGPYVVNITNVDVTNYQKNAMALNGTGLTANVVGCTTVGAGPTSTTAQNGIQFYGGDGGVIEDCSVTGNIYTGSGWAASGLLLWNAGTVQLTDTFLGDNDPSVYLQNTSATAEGLTLVNTLADAGNGFYVRSESAKKASPEVPGPVVEPASPAPFGDAPSTPIDGSRDTISVQITDSSFTGFLSGYGVSASNYEVGDTIDLTVERCTITNWEWGVVIFDSGGPVTSDFSWNQIAGNTYGFYSALAGQVAENNWWAAFSGPEDDGGTDEAEPGPPAVCYDPATMINADGAGDYVWDENIDYCPWLLAPPNSLTLEADDCQDDVDPGTGGVQIEVELWMHSLPQDVTGFQAFVEFNTAQLTFVSGTYTGTPFGEHIPPAISAVGNEIDLEGHTLVSQDPTSDDALLATLVFTVVDECDTTEVDFRTPFGPFVSELSFHGTAIPTNTINTETIRLDDTPPVIDVCPANTTVECDGAGNTASLNAWLASFAASDNCGTVTLTDDFTALSDDCGATGSATVTFTATDPCGNETSCTSTFTIEDTTAPSIDTPADHLTVECDGFGNTAELTAWLDSHGGAAASDDCGGVAWSHDFSALSDDCCATGSATVTFTATDDCGLTSTTTATFTIEDTTSPVVSGCPADIVVNADAGECTAVVTWTPPTATDVCCDDGLEVSVVSTHNPGDVFGLGLTTVTYTFEDDCGNTEICEFTVTVNDVNDVTATVILEGVDLDAPGVVLPVQRCIKFIAKNGTTCAEPVHVMVTFDTEDGTSGWAMGTAEFDVECGLWTELCAKDEQHTLYDTQDLTDLGTEYLAAADLYLMAGDTDNDSDVDIHDVTWLMYQWDDLAGAVFAGGCPWDGTRDADFNLNEFAGLSSDYLLLSNNWHEWSTCPCTALLLGTPATLSMEATLSARTLPAEVARAVDLNHDGLVDFRDVERFEALHGLPNTLSTEIRALDTGEQSLLDGEEMTLDLIGTRRR